MNKFAGVLVVVCFSALLGGCSLEAGGDVSEGDAWTACVWHSQAGFDCIGGSSTENQRRANCDTMVEQASASQECLEANYYLAVCQAAELDQMVVEAAFEVNLACQDRATALARLDEVCGELVEEYQRACMGVFDI